MEQPIPGRSTGLTRTSNPHSHIQSSLGKLSFGALAKAQDALDPASTTSGKRKRPDPRESRRSTQVQRGAKDGRNEKRPKSSNTSVHIDSLRRKHTQPEGPEDESSDDTDTSNSSDEDDTNPRARSSKHAPASLPSNRPVTRRRTILNSEARRSRDPRFDHVANKSNNPHATNQYGFLQQYRTSEMDTLREQIQESKGKGSKGKPPAITEAEGEVLKQELRRMEDRERTRTEKERLAELSRKHRQNEKELAKSGKKAYHLKNSDLKRLALTEKFTEMKGKDRVRAVERRRKKQGAKEKKAMPDERRAPGS
ncbi:DUF947-domain-containing protein [Eremomyces bilateralis CBS 781.70]|uniref:rRNA biogenesis protein RRP36 n=1 Tax=Eremomyces bilateralis CBS 781.70 TaxID=1392243 RepID=A0A6G1G9B2_9PEZI|nr:DUF947-domain-containing protein [Eremomyces bilateralis CBS 781.70]KAF1814624.1 DUF947-domain-containing protein [Eremomyces bilateralis CBS 781.70]